MTERADEVSKDDGSENRYIKIDLSINERNFVETPAVYATIPNVTFDGINYHLVFFTSSPSPVSPGEDSGKMSVAARLILPPLTVEATINEMIHALANPRPVGIFQNIVIEGTEDE